jgi:hypothetical protein
VRAVSWHAPWHQGQLGRNLLGWTCGSLGVGHSESPTVLWQRITLNLSLSVHIV